MGRIVVLSISIVNSLRMGLFLFIDGPSLVCGSVNFPILWPHDPRTNDVEVPQPGVGHPVNGVFTKK